MQDWIARVLDVVRLLPTELDALHVSEALEEQPIDWDPITQTCAGVRKRTPRCWTTDEIQKAFRKSTLKDHYHLSGAGTFAREQQAELVMKVEQCVKGVFLSDSNVTFETCERCGYSKTTWNGIVANGIDETHDQNCNGRPRLSAVHELMAAACVMWTIGNVPAMHALDRLILLRKHALITALAPFTDSKSRPKTRVQMIKEESQKPLSLG